MKIVIVDYSMGNIKSIVSTLKHLGVDDVTVSSEFMVLKNADKIILPGVGSFRKAMNLIKEKNIDQHLQEIVLGKKKPILGICLGMQLLGNSSTEDGSNQGLGFINGDVIKFDNTRMKVPHVGFNQVIKNDNSNLYRGLDASLDFYFTHSYKMISGDNLNQSMCEYGEPFIASFEIDNIAGVQYHPELSQNNGLNLLKNFIEQN